MKKIIYILLTILISTSKANDIEENKKEDLADAISLIGKFNKEDNIKCYSSVLKMSGYQSLKGSSFQFGETKFSKRSVICFNGNIGLMSNSDSVYTQLSKNTFVSYIKNENGIENIETIQLDFINNKIKYTKNILVETNTWLTQIQGLSAFIGDLYSIN